MTGTQALSVEQIRTVARMVEWAADFGFGSSWDGTGENTPHLKRGEAANVVIHQGLDSQPNGTKRVQINRCMASPVVFALHRDGSTGDITVTPAS